MEVGYFWVFAAVFLGIVAMVYFFMFMGKNKYAKYANAGSNLNSNPNCPNCSSDVSKQINAGRARAMSVRKNITKIKCGCGATSTWDIVGDPPIMKSFEKPPAPSAPAAKE